jgi:hypothetical protein
MQNNPDDNLPDEIKIEKLLSEFKPQPTKKFNAMMSSAPWQKQKHTRSANDTKNGDLHRKSAWALEAFIVILAFLILAFIPSVRVAADQIIHHFLLAASNQLEVQITPANPLVSMDFTNPSNFPLNINEVQQKAGFVVKSISSLPERLSFVGARYDPSYNAVTILYNTSDYFLILTQRPLGKSQDVFSIGPNAHVEFVNIGNIQGEYVVGGWNAVSTQQLPRTEAPQGTLNLSAVWDESLPQFTLRWQQAGYAYELLSNGLNSPSQSQLISWANELK